MKRVIVESPYAGNVKLHEAYARAAMKDCLERGEAPFCSHLLYTQPGVFKDSDPYERQRGLEAGFAWRTAADLTAFYVDLGLSRGMMLGLRDTANAGGKMEIRSLDLLPLIRYFAGDEAADVQQVTEHLLQLWNQYTAELQEEDEEDPLKPEEPDGSSSLRP